MLMPSRRRKFQRPLGERRYRKLFVIAVEGTKTEVQYFLSINDQQSIAHVNCLRSDHGTSPPRILKRMENHLQRERLKSSDEAWLVIDKDNWTNKQLAQLHAWSQTQENYGFALSNPTFEYWLLLHFEDGVGITSSQNRKVRLMQHLPNYNKEIDTHKFTYERVRMAVHRARLRDNPPCNDWPRTCGNTTVYKLIENIFEFKTRE